MRVSGNEEPAVEVGKMNTDADYGSLNLLPHHAQLLIDSAISPRVAKERGYFSATKKSQLKDLGFAEAQCRTPALVSPVYGVTGEVLFHQIRSDDPRSGRDGKRLKYETPCGARMALDIHPSMRQHLGNPSRPLFITEGVRKADSATSHNLCCIALLGVWNWRGSNEQGGKLALADWEYVVLSGREIYIVFDSDVMLKPAVHHALTRLKAFLEGRS